MSDRSWLRRKPETFWVQIGLGLTTVAWGLYVVTIEPAMDTMPVYEKATEFVPAWAWGHLALAIGLVQTICALAGMKWSAFQTWPCRATALADMLFWKVLAVSMINSGEQSPMAIALCGIAMMNLPVVLLPLLRPR